MLRNFLLSSSLLLALGLGVAPAQEPSGQSPAAPPQQQRIESFAGFGQAERDALGPEKAEAVLHTVNTVQCPCGCGRGSLANCRHTDPGCPVSPQLVARAIEIAQAEPSIDGSTLTARLQAEIQEKRGAQIKAREEAQARERERERRIHGVPVAGSPWKGVQHAKVTIVEFSEFLCPYCKRANPTLQQVLDSYPGQVKIVFKHYPVHQAAIPVAEAAVEAQEQRKFWKLHDVLFANFPNLGREKVEQLAGEVGMDVAKLRQALDTGEHRDRVQAEMRLAQELGVNATPTFFVNGRLVQGAQPFEAFRQKIDEELVRADKVLASGVPLEQLYDELTKPGQPLLPAPGEPPQAPAAAPAGAGHEGHGHGPGQHDH